MPPKTPYDTNALIKQTTDMLSQTKTQGTTAFAGSSYDTNRTGAVQAITPSALTTATPINPVTTTETPLPVVSPYTLTAPEQQAQVQETGLTKNIADLTAQLDPSFRRQAQIDQESKFGVQQKSDLLKSFQDKNANLQAEQQGINLQLAQTLENQKQAATGQGITAGGLAPHLNASRTQANQSLLSNAIQQFSNNANLAASQRDLSSAIAYADRAVESEFLPKEKALAVAQANLTNLRNSVELTSAQQKRADARQASIDAEKAKIADAKAVKTATNDARLKAIANNTGNPKLDTQTMALLSAAQTPEDVAGILQLKGLSSVSAGDQLDAKYKQAQIDKMDYEAKHPKVNTQVVKLDNGNTVLINTDTGATIKNYGGQKAGEAPTGSSSVVLNGTPTTVNNDALSYAQQYASTGKLPSPAELKLSGLSVSEVTQIAKGLPKPDGALIDNNTGVKPSSLSAAQEQGITAMNEIVTKSLPQLQALFPKLYTGLVGGVVGGAFPSQDRSDYNTLRADFLSKLLVARSGAAVTEQEYARYADLLPTTFNQIGFFGTTGEKKLASLAKSMQSNLDNTTNTLQVGIVGYTDVKKQLSQLSPEQKAELEKENLLPAWAK